MRLLSACAAAALLAIPSLGFGYSTPPPAKSGPPVVPYLCSDGRPASVVYESGNDFVHAKALVTWDGRTLELEAAPTLYGVRYRAEEGEPPLAWSLRGEEAWLTEAPEADSYTREERELARCIRLRGAANETAAAEPGHGEHGEHGEDHTHH